MQQTSIRRTCSFAHSRASIFGRANLTQSGRTDTERTLSMNGLTGRLGPGIVLYVRLEVDRPALVGLRGQLLDEARGLQDDVHAVAVAGEHRVHERDLVFRARH